MFTYKQYNRIIDIIYEIDGIINVNINEIKGGLERIEKDKEE